MPFIKGQSGNPGGRVGVPTEMATHQCWNARFIRARLAAHWLPPRRCFTCAFVDVEGFAWARYWRDSRHGDKRVVVQ